MEAVDFSGIARAYRWMEYLSFGPVLHRVRCWRLPQMAQAKRALVLGDGDGRFLAQLQRVNPTIEIDAVDCSPAMVRLAQSRVASGRVHWIVEDARSFAPAGMYDLIVSHFFLDCFSTTDVNRMAQRFSNHMAEGGLWVNSDFHVPPGWARPPTIPRCWRRRTCRSCTRSSSPSRGRRWTM